MNRFEYTVADLSGSEYFLIKDRNVRLYDGDQKTSFEGGELYVTTHRIFWGKPGSFSNGQICLALPMKLITGIEEESPGTFSFTKNRKIILHLSEPDPDRNEGPQPSSLHDYVKLSFREGYARQLPPVLADCLHNRQWERDVAASEQPGRSEDSRPPIKLRTGIVGIERGLLEKQKATDESISLAFQDLDKLMGMAKEMVRLSQNISTKIREKQGEITEDETVRFKSYLLSLGIDDPVTRDSHRTDDQFRRGLARQICEHLRGPVEAAGGAMVLADVYCRLNRARGLDLVSPEDLLDSCRLMQAMGLPLRMHEFESGVRVVQLEGMDGEAVADATAELLEEKGSLHAEELAQLLGISVILAKERLLTAEKYGKSCRDDSIEGLKFYPNLFLTRD